VAVEHRMHGALGRQAHVAGKLANEQFADFACAPMRLVALEIDDQPLHQVRNRIHRRKAGVPKEVTFKTKPAIALEQLPSAAGLPRGVVLMDAGYGADTNLRTTSWHSD
jgi:SRSO17 transposase